MKIIWEPEDKAVSKDEVKDYLRQAVFVSIIAYKKYVDMIMCEIERKDEDIEEERRERKEMLLQEIRLMSVMVTTFTRYIREMDERTVPFPT